MIKIHIDKGELKDGCVEFGGTMDDIIADIMFQISMVYGCVKQKNKDAAEEFKRSILSLLVDDEAKALVFDDKLVKELSKHGVVRVVSDDVGDDDSKKNPASVMKTKKSLLICLRRCLICESK